MYSTKAFWKKRPIGQVYRKGRNHRRNVTSQTPVVSMTTRLIIGIICVYTEHEFMLQMNNFFTKQ